MTNDEIYLLCVSDLNRVIQILASIIAEKQLTDAEQIRIDYCVKIVNDVNEKQLHINAVNEE